MSGDMSQAARNSRVGTVFGHYRLVKLLGRGGMGEVYEAYDTIKDRTVALKLLPEDLAADNRFRQRFRRESHTAARLSEPHIIPIHDYGEIDGLLYIDMRLIRGADLGSLLSRDGPMPPERAVTIIGQIAAALDAAHADGLIHRDIKPANILITDGDFAYLVDFGIARSPTGPGLTSTGTAIGTCAYMAPERFQSEEVTPRTDIYSLACVLHECLTGTCPYVGDVIERVISGHLFDPIPRPSVVYPGVPIAFDEVIARGMAKDSDDRFGTAAELAYAARRALHGGDQRMAGTVPDGTAAAPTGTELPARRGRSKRRRWLMVSAAVVVSAAGLGVWIAARPPSPPWAGTSKLSAAEVALLKLLPPGYSQDTCTPEWPPTPRIALAQLHCAGGDPPDSVPSARYLSFADVTSLRDAYTLYADHLQIVDCPDGSRPHSFTAPGRAQPTGQVGCYLSTDNPPMAGVFWTSEPDRVLGFAVGHSDRAQQLFAWWQQVSSR
ncbi:serine/threonine-protein kinase [Nocardia sp. NPDC059246]|uniref:serine/threonine-protein kinase n=1 Tax=unclassified Nocardia TaxID=2637762 RepID=UPI003691D45C